MRKEIEIEIYTPGKMPVREYADDRINSQLLNMELQGLLDFMVSEGILEDAPNQVWNVAILDTQDPAEPLQVKVNGQEYLLAFGHPDN